MMKPGHTLFCEITKRYLFVKGLRKDGAIRVCEMSGIGGKNGKEEFVFDTRSLRYAYFARDFKADVGTNVGARRPDGEMIFGRVVQNRDHWWSGGKDLDSWILWDTQQEVPTGKLAIRTLTPLEALAAVAR